jgi:hypothetical protein
MILGGSLGMLAVFIFALSFIAARDFLLYFWRAVSNALPYAKVGE